MKKTVTNFTNNITYDIVKREPITENEITKVIKTSKIGKSTGPDGVSNRLIRLLHKENIQKFTCVLNNLYQENVVPEQWKKGTITSIFKGKGTRGNPKNDRGITISSNVLKIMEKVLKNKMINDIYITEYQGGGRPRIGTRDHIIIISSLIQKYKRDKKPLHMVFLDVKKAFDKGWFNGILHLLKERGLGNEYTSYLKELNKNYQVNIKTPHVITDIVSCEDVLKQGSVLSPIEFGITTDEIAIMLGKKNIGINIGDTKLPCTLWVDDIQCANETYDEAQQAVNIISSTADKYIYF